MDLTEGGIRVPYIAHWPARIAAGGVSEQLCMTMDWSATMLDAAGVAAASRLSARRRLAAAACCATRRDAFDRPLYWRMKHRDQRALRDGRWKYLKVDEHEYLFDVDADERERANQRPARARRGSRRCATLARTGTRRCRRSPDDAKVSLGYSAADMPQR